MTYQYATWLASVLREAGVTVVEYPGWRSRGLGHYKPFDPEYVVWHHDASAPGDSPGVPASMVSRMETAGAQIWVDRAGRWHLVAAGRMAHTGQTDGTVTNENSLGIETDHTSGEAWPPAQLESLRIGTAAILRHFGRHANHGLHFHKSICVPKGRKIDPAGLSLFAERRHVNAIIDATDKRRAPARPPVAEAVSKAVSLWDRWMGGRGRVVSVSALQRAARRDPGRRQGGFTFHARDDVYKVERALRNEGLLDGAWDHDGSFGSSTIKAYAAWQRRLGYRGKDADGIPGRASLEALGRKYGFRVIR